MTGPPQPYEADQRTDAETVAAPVRGGPGGVAADPPAATEESSVAHGWSRSRRTTAVFVTVLILALAGTVWVASRDVRDYWWPGAPRVSAEPDESGTATVAAVAVSLEHVFQLDPAAGDGSGGALPAGYAVWEVALRTETANEDLFACTVELVDEAGRLYEANVNVSGSSDYVYSYICGLFGSAAEDPPPPVQRLLVLMPAEVRPVSVRITADALLPEYLEFPLP